MKNNIILTGFMGAGKTEIGRLLAKKYGFNFIDLDFVAESYEGTTVSEIFKQKGEIYFRELESKILHAFEKDGQNFIDSLKNFIDITVKSNNFILHEKDSLWVIATGGGTPVYNNNLSILKKLGFVIYLKASGKTIYQRIRTGKNRPLLGEDGFSENDIENRLFEREKFYKKADITIYTDGLSLTGITEEIGIFTMSLLKD